MSMKEWLFLPPKGLERSWGQSSKPSPSLQAGGTRVQSSQGTFPLSPGPLPLERAGGSRGHMGEDTGWCFLMGLFLHSWCLLSYIVST